jgi:hypothetical protein
MELSIADQSTSVKKYANLTPEGKVKKKENKAHTGYSNPGNGR